MFGKILVLRILGKLAKVPNLVGVLKLSYLPNGCFKSKSVLIFKERKESSMSPVKTVFRYFVASSGKSPSKFRQKMCHFLMVFHILQNIPAIVFFGNGFKSCSIIGATFWWKPHVRQKSRSGVTELNIPKIRVKIWKNRVFQKYL